MKKLVVFAALTLFGFTASAQYNKGYDEGNGLKRGHDKSWKEDKWRDERGHNGRGRGNDDFGQEWGYDRDYRQVRGRAVAINSFQRQARERIADGVASGRLTSRETARLLAFSERIERKENRFMRFGRLSNAEIRELREDMEILNRMISRELRDGSYAPIDRNGRGGRY